MRAAGVNFADHLARVGLYSDAPKVPSVVGYEVAGTVESVVNGVDPARVGQRVLAEPVSAATPRSSTRSQRHCPAAGLDELRAGRRGPGQLHDGVGSAARLRLASAGEQVLVHAAAGGVGIAAVQLAKAAGAVVHGTASPGKHSQLAALGVDRAIDYRHNGWWKGLGPYDIVLDALGGTSLRRSMGLLRPGGRLVAYGLSALQQGEKRSLLRAAPQALAMVRGFNLINQLNDSKTVIGLNMLRLWDDRGTLEPWIGPLSTALSDGTAAPIVHAAVPFADAPEAHRILAARENVGKVVLVP